MVLVPNNDVQRPQAKGNTLEDRTDTIDRLALLRVAAPEIWIRKGLPMFTVMDWQARQERWEYSRMGLERLIPDVFTMDYFLKLPRLGGGREAEARELVFDQGTVFRSFSGIVWPRVVIKRFYWHSRTDQLKQARAMHSFHILSDFWFRCGRLPSVEGNPAEPLIRIPEVITLKYPFSVMRSLNYPDTVRADLLDRELKQKVYNNIVRFGNLLVYHQKEKVIRRFERAGLEYPNPDFNPKNVFAKLDHKNSSGIRNIWVIDQASSEGGPTYEGLRRKGSSGIMFDTAAWGLNSN